MRESEPLPQPPRPERRWYRHTPCTLLVGETPSRFQFSLARLLGSFVFFALAFGTPALVAQWYEVTHGAWALCTAVLLLTWLGAAIGLLRAGIRGAIAGSLTALVFLFAILAGVMVGVIIHRFF